MTDDLYTIIGATGNIGQVTARALLEKGKKVRAVGRRTDRLKPLEAAGAEAFAGSAENPTAMTHALEGAAGALLLLPPNYDVPDFRAYYNLLGQSLTTAVKATKVSWVVFISSIGADLETGTGPILGLRDQEMRLEELGEANVLNLRPAYFMENHLHGIPMIKEQGVYGSPIQPEVTLPMIATRDIGLYAAERLARHDWTGHTTRELLGDRDYSLVDATRILGAAVGKPDLAYVTFPYEEAEKAMQELAGASPGAAATMTEMYKAFNRNAIVSVEGRSTESTTPTSMETFAQEVFAPAYAAA